MFFSACVSPSDPTLTVERVREVMAEVGNWEKVATFLKIPDFVRELVKDEAPERVGGEREASEREEGCLMGEMWVNADPDASWEWLSMALYHVKSEEKAAAMAKQHLPQGMCICWTICKVRYGLFVLLLFCLFTVVLWYFLFVCCCLLLFCGIFVCVLLFTVVFLFVCCCLLVFCGMVCLFTAVLFVYCCFEAPRSRISLGLHF